MTVHSNMLCPCGSGKKYKRCCGTDRKSSDGSTDRNVVEKLKQAIHESGAVTIDEMNEVAKQVNVQHNARSIKEFLGLSPSQMTYMLYQPLQSPHIVTFDEDWYPEGGQALELFSKLADAIGEAGVRATQRGNLPIKLCREILANTSDELSMRPPGITTENDFSDLYTIRLIGEVSGLIDKSKSRFVLTDLGKEVRRTGSESRLFNELFKSYVTTFNWSYRDYYPDAEIIQTGWLFSLYCLSLFGYKWRRCRFYGERFLQAFPSVLKEKNSSENFSCEKHFYECYQTRSLTRFAYFWGLASMKQAMDSKNAWFDFEIKAKSLNEWIVFNA